MKLVLFGLVTLLHKQIRKRSNKLDTVHCNRAKQDGRQKQDFKTSFNVLEEMHTSYFTWWDAC